MCDASREQSCQDQSLLAHLAVHVAVILSCFKNIHGVTEHTVASQNTLWLYLSHLL